MMRTTQYFSKGLLIGVAVLVATVLTALWSSAQPRLAGSLLDNERVTVLRVTWEPGKFELPAKPSSDIIVIQATPGESEVTIGDQKTTGRQEVGKVWFMSKDLERAVKNTGTQPFDWILVRLK
jgi:hypothetical protein